MMWRRTGVKTEETPSDTQEYEALGYLDIESVLSRSTTNTASVGSETQDLNTRISRLQLALAELQASHADGVYSANRIINPLLDVWSLAEAVGRAQARPIERFLSALIVRSVTTAAEISACVDEVNAALGGLSAV